ncbi:MAG: hypothetical protein DSY42_01640 [Aquifex sp.]|nr:MAG: hypothetical protein DSY42_01640 [Aquifex sp.]
MKRWALILLVFMLAIPVFSEAKSKSKYKGYYAYKYKKYKKRYRKRYWIRRYPIKANTKVNADYLKLQEMVRDLF